jgi:hypothetical protein
MTYPPQQQPEPWGQNPYGQQPDPWGQQQQPPPPQDPWGGGGYDGYGQPPPKKGSGKTIAIILVVVVVLAGAGVGLFFLLKGNKNNDPAQGMNPNDPKSVAVAWADLYARAYNSDYQDVKADQLKPLMCQSQYKGLDDEQKAADAQRAAGSSMSNRPTPTHSKYQLQIGDVKTSGDSATVTVTAVPQNGSGSSGSASNEQSGPRTQTKAFDMKKENGGWKVCGPQAGNGGTGGSGPAPSASGGANPPVPGSGGSGGGSGVPVPSGSLKPLPSGIPLPTH